MASRRTSRKITDEEEALFREEFAKSVKRARLDSGEIQAEVAEAVGVPLGVYQSWEAGRATPRGLAAFKLYHHFGWPLPFDVEVIRWYTEWADDQQIYALSPSVVEDSPTGKRVPA